MAKQMSKLDIMNTMGDAADKKAKMQPQPKEPDADDAAPMPGKKSPKQAAAIGEKKKAPPIKKK